MKSGGLGMRLRLLAVFLAVGFAVAACGVDADGAGAEGGASSVADEEAVVSGDAVRASSPEEYMALLPSPSELPIDGLSLDSETWMGEERYEDSGGGSSSGGLLGCVESSLQPIAELSYSTASREYEGWAEGDYISQLVTLAVTAVPGGDSSAVYEAVLGGAERCGEFVKPNEDGSQSQHESFVITGFDNVKGNGFCSSGVTAFESGYSVSPVAIHFCSAEDSGDIMMTMYMDILQSGTAFDDDHAGDFTRRGTQLAEKVAQSADFTG